MRASFTSELRVAPVHRSDTRWRLAAPLTYLAGEGHAAGQVITVPSGFETDFASIPRIFWRIILPSGSHREAAVVHDWLYFCGDRHKVVADGIFMEAMKCLGVPKWRRVAMFYAVLFFGRNAWNAHRRAGHHGRVKPC